MTSCSGRSIKLIAKVILTGLKGILTTGSGGWAPRASFPQTLIAPLCLGNRSIPQTLLGNMSALCPLQIVPCNIFQTVSSVRTPCRQRLTPPCCTARSPIHKVPRVPRAAPGNAGASLAFKVRFYCLCISGMPLVTKQNPFVGFRDQN